MSQFVTLRYAHCTLGVCFVVLAMCWTGSPKAAISTTGLDQNSEKPPVRLEFLREFSSADDVRRGLPPVVNQSLNILAGRPDPRALADKLVGPTAVVTDSANRVFVSDLAMQMVHVFDFEGFKYSFLGGRGGRLRLPGGIAVDGEDHLYVTDTVAGVVLVYDSKGKFLRYLGKTGDETYFQAPIGIAIQRQTGHIYVCDSRRHMVILLDSKGHILGHFGRRWGGKGPGDFRYPSRIAISGDEIFVLDSGNSRLQILDLAGHFRREIKFPELSADTGLTLDASKNIYLTDLQLNAINIYNYDGQFLFRFGRGGTKAGEFAEPSGLWVDSSNHLYVADTKNQRIQVFQIQPSP